MITKIDEHTLDFLSKRKLTFNQFCICLLLYHQDVAAILKYTDTVGYLSGGTIKGKDGKQMNEMEDLIARGFIEHDNIEKDNWWSLDNFKVTEKFTKGFLDRFDAYASEIWHKYPKFLFINNEKIPAKAVDFDEFKEKYIKILEKDLSVHEEALRCIELSKKGEYASMKLMNYIGSRHWENLKDAKQQKVRLH